MRRILEEKNNWLRLLVWLTLMVMMTMLLIIVFGLLPIDHTSTTSLKWLQVGQTVVVFVLPAWLVTCMWTKRPYEWLRLHRGMQWQTALWAMACIVTAMPAINMLCYLNEQMRLPEWLSGLEQLMRQQEDAARALTERFLQVDGLWQLLLTIVLMAVLPALGEELTFRGLIQGLLSRDSKRVPHVAIWVTAMLFSAVHFQFYGFVPRMLLGAMFGYAVFFSGSLWVPVLMHLTNNTLAVVTYYIGQHTTWLDSDMAEQIGTGDTWYVGLVSGVVCCLCVWRLIKGCSSHR